MHRSAVLRGSLLTLTTVMVLTAGLFGIQAAPAEASSSRAIGGGAVSDPPAFTVISKAADGVTLRLSLPSVVVEDLSLGGEAFQLLSIPGGGESGAVGAPSLPTVTRLLAIPEGADAFVSAVVEEEETVSGIRPLPVQDETGETLAFDPEAYAKSGLDTEPIVSLGEPAMMRGLRVVPLTIRPVRYDPVRNLVTIAKGLRIEAHYVGGAPAAARPGRPIAASFDRLYRALVVNYETPPEGVRTDNGTWLVICQNDTQITTRLQPLLDWRTRMGYITKLATTAETGTTKEAIKSYIQNAYDHWVDPPEFIVLAGDAAGSYSIPTWQETSQYHGEGDHPYGQLAGGDILLDAHIGRLSFGTLTDLETIVAKTVNYESTPYVSDANWFTRACLVGDPYDSGYSTVMVQQWIKTRLRQVGYAQVDTIFNSPFVSQMTTALNRGDTIYCYRGIYGVSGWSNSNTYALTNTNKLPFVCMSTCGTGSFQGETAYSEAFLRVGTAAAPRGAVGAIGTATTGTHTRFNNCFTYGVFHGLLFEDMWEMGVALTRGKYELYTNYKDIGTSWVTMFSYWNNLMGDPACRVWTAYPSPLTASYPTSISVGANSATVTVYEQGSVPCAGAQVCLWNGTETHAVGITDAAGNCELAISASTPGTMKLTVTKHNRAPLLADIPVTAASLFLGNNAFVVDDDELGGSHGNEDGQVNPNETIQYWIQLRNSGGQPATGITAVLTTSDPYVTILDPNATFEPINPGAIAWPLDSFAFWVSPGCPQNHPIRFALNVTADQGAWHSLAEHTVISADLVATAVQVIDAGNGRLDPGETVPIGVLLRNDGPLAAAGTSAILSSLSPWVAVTDVQGSYGRINPGSTVENSLDRFSVSAAASTYQGHRAWLRLVTTFNGGVTDTTEVSFIVGQGSSDDPIGPDRRGYYAFDNTDTGYSEAPVYDWVEIASNQGGTGTQVTLGDYGEYQDKSRAVDLPFPFQFYGQTFTRATICSNGWLAMGDTYLTDYRNWTIPGAGAPQNLIAAFWDDLQEYNSGGGHVYQKNDTANHRYIVEWSRLRNAYGGSTETFEAILYDPAYYPTANGDGIIVFQYNQVTNPDPTDNFATVGIQNADMSDGVLYTYGSLYPSGAATLTAGRAIRFRPVTPQVTGVSEEAAGRPVVALEQGRPSPFAGSTVITYVVATEGPTALTIYDVQGRAVRHLVEGMRPAGSQSVSWNGRDDAGRLVPSGLFFCRLDAGGHRLVQRLLKVD